MHLGDLLPGEGPMGRAGPNPHYGQAGGRGQAGSPREMPCGRVPGGGGVLGRQPSRTPLLRPPSQRNKAGKGI